MDENDPYPTRMIPLTRLVEPTEGGLVGRSLVIPCLTHSTIRIDGCLEHSGLLTVTSAGAPDGV